MATSNVTVKIDNSQLQRLEKVLVEIREAVDRFGELYEKAARIEAKISLLGHTKKTGEDSNGTA